MVPKIRVTTVQPHGSCHECGQIDHSSPHILVQRRNDGRSGGPVDSEAHYCGRCEPTIMERLQQQDEAGLVTVIDAR